MPSDTTGKTLQVLDLVLEFLLTTTIGREAVIMIVMAATALSARSFIFVRSMGFRARR